jgi:trehalose/maltose transport system substrate-binding protein
MRSLFCWVPGLVLLSVGCGPASKPEPVKLTIFGIGLEAGEQLREDALKEFTGKTGIQVDVLPTLGTSSEQLALGLKLLERRSATPDIFVIDIIWPGSMGGHLLDLGPYLDDEARGHLPTLLENNTVANRVVCLPFYMNSGMLYYRSDLLKKYGYQDPPGTWSELERMALRIQQGERREGRKDFWGFVWQGNAYEASSPSHPKVCFHTPNQTRRTRFNRAGPRL